jgi:iron complex outermembrane receptor protein
MNFRQKKLAVALSYALGLGGATALLTAGPATAQQTAPTDQAQGTIRVEVTGSSIKRIEGEGALPVTVITRDEIDKSGATTVPEILNLVSANNTQGAIQLNQAIGITSYSNQTASLRGLGGTGTLVLVNGKRLGAFAGGVQGTEGTNLAFIPFSAIERVEVLTDGASAIYGSDAVGGVINFIMRQDYQGADATFLYGSPTQGPGNHGSEYQVQATVGFGSLATDKYNVFGSFNYQEQKPLYDIDRSFSNTSYIPYIGLNSTSGQTFPGYISTGGIGSLTYPNCGPIDVTIGTRCRYDPNGQPGVEQIAQNKTFNFFGAARYQINNDWQAYVTGLYSHSDNDYIIQPAPISDQISTITTPTGGAQILLPPSSPYYPTAAAIAAGVNGLPLNVRWRCYPCGFRDQEDIGEAYQVVAGVKGSQWNWDFDGSFNYSQNTLSDQLNNGFPLYTPLLALLNSGTINVLTGNVPADQAAALHATDFTGQAAAAKLKSYGIDLKASSDIYQLPAGPLATAVGLQTVHTALTQNFAPVLQAGELAGFGGAAENISATRNQWAVFGELNVPVVKNLEGDIQIRYDHYSDFGSTTNPKISLRWQPYTPLLLRASYGTGFLAPTLFQLYTPQIQNITAAGSIDPLRCPNPNAPNAGSNPDCNSQFPDLLGGNPHLLPQTSSQWQVGGVFEPVAGVSFGLDYFQLLLSNVVSSGVPLNVILNPNTYATYSYLVTRAASCVGGQPCPITSINQLNVNFGKTRIQGFDVDIKMVTPASAWGRVKFEISGTYYTRYDTRNPDGSYTSGISNQYSGLLSGTLGVIPRWKSYAPLTWEYGPWSATLANTYQSGYTDYQSGPNGTRTVGTLTLWDLQGVYTGFKNTTLTLGLKNALNTNPPVSNSYLSFVNGYDPTYWDPRQRFIYGSIKYVFNDLLGMK